MIVVVVEAALTKCHGAKPNERTQRVRRCYGIVRRCFVWVHACSKREESGVLLCERLSTRRGGDRFTDNCDTDRPSPASTLNDRVAVLVEGGVDQVRVRVEKREH